MKARIHGVTSQMNTFRYTYGIMLGELGPTAETRRQPELNSAAKVAVRCEMSASGVDEAVETL